MKKIVSFLPALVLVLSFSLLHSCSSSAQQSSNSASAVAVPAANALGYHDAGAPSFKQLIQENPDAILLDVRTPKEVAQSNIEGHRLIDFYSPNFLEELKKLDRDKTYLIYCRSGRRSGIACQAMAKEGFTSLYNLKGGMNAWNTAR